MKSSNSQEKENDENDVLIITENLTGPQLMVNFEDQLYFINSNNYGQ